MATAGDKEMGPIFSETPVAVKPIHSAAEKENNLGHNIIIAVPKST